MWLDRKAATPCRTAAAGTGRERGRPACVRQALRPAWALLPCLLLLLALAPGARAAARLSIPAGAQQLLVVSSPTPVPPRGIAAFALWERTAAAGAWRRVLGPWPAETGYGHLSAARREGDGSTPVGVFAIGTTIYGTQPDPGRLHVRYHRLVCGDWWDEDPASPLYNTFVHVPCGLAPPFAGGSEALWTQTVAYSYFAPIAFNTDPVVGGALAPGSAIFLHNWVGGYTAGCIALKRPELLRVLRRLQPARHPVIEIATDGRLARLAAPTAPATPAPAPTPVSTPAPATPPASPPATGGAAS